MLELPPPRADDVLVTLIFDTYRWVIGWLPRGGDLPPYRETGVQRAAVDLSLHALVDGFDVGQDHPVFYQRHIRVPDNQLPGRRKIGGPGDGLDAAALEVQEA